VTAPLPNDLVSVRGIDKAYGATTVLRDLSVSVRAGEVHSILGENGAGKSTLIKILAGLVAPDAGEILIDGQTVTFRRPHEAFAAGIGTVHQEFTNCPQLDVVENLFLGQRLPRTRTGLIKWSEAQRRAGEVLEELNVDVAVTASMQSLSPASRKLVEIARGLLHGTKILVLDEPTSALDVDESERLFEVVGRLRSRGAGVLYVSHRMHEVESISDRISVLRDGAMVATVNRGAASIDELVSMMVGRDVTTIYPPRDGDLGDVLLRVADLSLPGSFSGVSFTARRGEVLGIAGLDGSGRSEVAQALAGVAQGATGHVWLDSEPAGPHGRVVDAIKQGFAYVPPDRQGLGLFLNQTISDNVALPSVRRLRRGPFHDRRKQRAVAAGYVSDLQIRARDVDQLCQQLSGGNQQKVLLAKWLATSPRVLALDEPTSGVDVGAKVEIHRLIRTLAAAGTVVVVASSDLEELLGMSDSIIVMRAGRLAAHQDARETSAEAIAVAAASGHGESA
jgi:ribose transport system ATP-binding protein